MTYPYGNTGGPLCPAHGIPLSSVYHFVGTAIIRQDYCPICKGSAEAIADYRVEPRTESRP